MATSLIRQFQPSDICQNFTVHFRTCTHLKGLAQPVSTALCQDAIHGENTFYKSLWCRCCDKVSGKVGDEAVWCAVTRTPEGQWLQTSLPPAQQCTCWVAFVECQWLELTWSLSPQAYICYTNNVSCHWATHCSQILTARPAYTDQVFDQFAYKPTGSTTSALIAITHHISHLLESSSYVRCILIDYSKASDTINHLTLFQKLRQLTIPPNVF